MIIIHQPINYIISKKPAAIKICPCDLRRSTGPPSTEGLKPCFLLMYGSFATAVCVASGGTGGRRPPVESRNDCQKVGTPATRWPPN